MAILKTKNKTTGEWEEIQAIKGDKGDTGPSEWGVITGSISNQTDLKNALDSKANTTDLSTVATSGSYNDLSNKPTIPDELSDLSDDATHRLVTDTEKSTWNAKSNFSGSYNDLTNKPTIPTKVSDLSNDTGFIVNTVNNLTNYYTKTNTYTKSEVDSLIGAVSSLNIEIVQTLPTHDISTSTIYLVPKTASTNDNYDEYIYVNNNWEHIGSTEVDLSNYYTKTQVDNLLDDKADITDIPSVGNAKTYYGTCSTGETVQEKIVVCNNFVLETGATIFVKFTNGNKSSYPTKLNVNSTGAKNITRVGEIVTTTYYWTFGELVGFTYDGANWVMLERGTANTEYYGITKLSSSTSSTSTELAATSSAVKAAYDLANGKQDALVSGTNIKTINNETLLGSGNINISSGGGGTMVDMRVNDTSVVSDDIGNIVTESAYDSSTNKIATMDDIPTVPTKTSDLTNDSGFISTEADPTVPSHVKSITQANITSWNNKSTFSGDYDDLTNKPSIPTKTSDLTNDSNFIDGLVILSYGNSTWNDFINAYNKNKVVYCRASSGSNPASGSQTRLAFMAYVNNASSPTEVEFQYYRSVSTHSSSQQGDQVFVYKLTNAGTWTVATREASSKVVAGTGLESSYSNGAITVSGKAGTGISVSSSGITNTGIVSIEECTDSKGGKGHIWAVYGNGDEESIKIHGLDDAAYKDVDSSIGAVPGNNLPTSSAVASFVEGKGYSTFSGSYNDLTNKPTIPTATSDLTNDSGFISTETDPVFSGSPAANILTSDLTNWNNKQDALVSGTNIKTINSTSLLGSGNIDISGCPTGSISIFAGTTSPTGYLMCDGAAVSRTTYADLFSVIGTTYGTGDGSTTFNLPNLKGKVVVGLDANDTDFNTIGNTGGEKTHTLTVDEMPSHKHNFRGHAPNRLASTTSTSLKYGIVHDSTLSVDAFVREEGGSQAHNILQPYVVLNYIIKV